MSADDYRSYDELIVELRRLCAARRTGTLFIATADNEAGQLGLRDGLVVTARFRRKTGIEAAYGLRKIGKVRFTFTRDFLEAADRTLSSGAVLAVLTDTELPPHPLTPAHPPASVPPLAPATPVAPVTPVAPPPPDEAHATTAPPPVDTREAIRAALTAELAEYLGPMAAVIVREQLLEAGRVGRDPADVVDALAMAIDDPAAAMTFKKHARTALARL
jgi:hypothetical protein